MLVPPESSRKLLDAASASYRMQLSGSPAEEYLIEDRGFSNETLRYSQIGFVGTPEPGDDMFRGMISFPFITVSGVVAIQFRKVGGTKSRFLSRGSIKRIYNPMTLLKPHRLVYLCEGLTDTNTVIDLNLPVIGIPGVDNWSPLFARALRNRRVVVLADGDDNGQGKDFAAKVSADVDECATILFDGTDVNRFRMDFGYDALRKKIELDR